MTPPTRGQFEAGTATRRGAIGRAYQWPNGPAGGFMAFKGPYPTVFSGHTTAMVISATAFSGGVSNVGTIGPHGISVLGATLLSGGIVDTGIISGGIRIDSHGKIVGSSGPAISVHDA